MGIQCVGVAASRLESNHSSIYHIYTSEFLQLSQVQLTFRKNERRMRCSSKLEWHLLYSNVVTITFKSIVSQEILSTASITIAFSAYTSAHNEEAIR
jgi:hypothetical protein